MAKGLTKVRQKVSQILFEEDMRNYLNTIIKYWNIPSTETLKVITYQCQREKEKTPDNLFEEIDNLGNRNLVEDLGLEKDILRISDYLWNQFEVLYLDWGRHDEENPLDTVPGSKEIKERIVKNHRSLFVPLMKKIEKFIDLCEEDLGTIRTYLPEMADIIMVKKTGRTQAGRFRNDPELIRTKWERWAACGWLRDNSPKMLKLAGIKKQIEDAIVAENLGISDAVNSDRQKELEASGWKKGDITISARVAEKESGRVTIVCTEDHDFKDLRKYYVKYHDDYNIDHLPESISKLLKEYIQVYHMKDSIQPIDELKTITGLTGDSYEGTKKEIMKVREDMKKRAEEIKPWVQKS